MRRTLAVLVAFVLALGGCHSAPTSGVVTSKQHKDPFDYFILTCVFYGKYGCSSWMPIPVHEPEKWFLCLRNGGDEGCRQVDSLTWSQVKVGDTWHV